MALPPIADPWVGVDLDGTLALHPDSDEWTWESPLDIGRPIAPMVDHVRSLLATGVEVRIFTARAYAPDGWMREDGYRIGDVVAAIHDWLEDQGLPRLEVTCVKDWRCVQIIDDIAQGVERDTGRLR